MNASDTHPIAQHVLVVEDDECHIELIRRVMTKRAPEVCIEYATTLEAAKDAMNRRAFDLVVTDLHLPDGSGLELLDFPTLSAQQIAVVIMTGQGCEEHALDAMRRGALDYVVKDPQQFPLELPRAVRRALGEGRPG